MPLKSPNSWFWTSRPIRSFHSRSNSSSPSPRSARTTPARETLFSANPFLHQFRRQSTNAPIQLNPLPGRLSHFTGGMSLLFCSDGVLAPGVIHGFATYWDPMRHEQSPSPIRSPVSLGRRSNMGIDQSWQSVSAEHRLGTSLDASQSHRAADQHYRENDWRVPVKSLRNSRSRRRGHSVWPNEIAVYVSRRSSTCCQTCSRERPRWSSRPSKSARRALTSSRCHS